MAVRWILLALLLLVSTFVAPADAQRGRQRRVPERPGGKRGASARGTDYYKVLGVPRTADEKAIKKAFRKLSVEWHPDKNPDNKEEAEEKFKEIANAYTVLTDPEKRKIYDMGGEEALKQGGGGGGGAGPGGGMGIDPREIFKQFFGAEGGPESMFSSFSSDGAQFSFGGGGPGGFGGGGGGGGGGMGTPAPAPSQLHEIRLTKGGAGLGMKVDKENSVIAVTAGGAAEKSGMRVGDVVWEIDGVKLGAGKKLAQVIDSSRLSHTLKVAYMKGEDGQAIEVRMRRPDGGLGLRVDNENVISKILPGGAASEDGRMRVGDKILSVNGISLRGKKLADALPKVRLTLFLLSTRLPFRMSVPAAIRRIARSSRSDSYQLWLLPPHGKQNEAGVAVGVEAEGRRLVLA